jgi:hypothetical protein
MEKMKQKQAELESLLQNLLDTKDATLSKTTKDTIRNIMFLFEHRFDSLEQELLAKIKQTAAWIESIPIVEQEHTEMKHHVDQLLAHTQLLDAHIRKMEGQLKHNMAIQPLVERIAMLEQKIDSVLEQKDVVDRWTDPKNAMCRIPYIYLQNLTYGPFISQGEILITDYLLKPFPNYAMERSTGIKTFLSVRRHEYICPCYNCVLNDMFKLKVEHRGQDEKRIMCPLDSECTCMTTVHRKTFIHSIEVGYIKGKDTELSPIQRYYAKNIQLPYIGSNYLVCIPTLKDRSVSQDGIVNVISGQFPALEYEIVNCTRRDGVDVYQYLTPPYTNGRYQLHETTADKLYVMTNELEYPPRDPSLVVPQSYSHNRICVPIEKYIADTMVDERFFSGKVKQKRSKKTTKSILTKRTRRSTYKKRM